LKSLIKAHVINKLKNGVDVVLDFPANTVKQRKWVKELVADAKAKNELL